MTDVKEADILRTNVNALKTQEETLMKNDRTITEKEYLERWRYKKAIEKDYRLTSLPRMFDFYSNGWVVVERGRQKEGRIRLLVTSTLLCTPQDKSEKHSEQINLDITMANAEKLRNQLTVLLKSQKRCKRERERTAKKRGRK